MAHLERVITLVDMDAFYCQVEEKLNPNIKNKPIAVVQYNAWRGGGIIAVNYPARDRGVTRHMRGDEAQKICPEIILCKVPCVRGKADLTKYREAGKDVANVLYKFTNLLQRASIDEAYLDITDAVNQRIELLQNKEVDLEEIPNTFIYGADKQNFLYDVYNNSDENEANIKLIVGGVIMEEIRAAVYQETGFQCSAGIAHNKILAKLVCSFHKPNKQTILPHENVKILYKQLPIHKIKSLGGKFGETLAENLNIQKMFELEQFSEKFLQQKFDLKTGSWLYNIARGIDLDPVTTRLCPKSIGCCKRFPGQTALITPHDIQHWIGELASEVVERLNQDLAENNRYAKQIIVQYSLCVDKKNVPSSKTRPISVYDDKKIASDAFDIIHKANSLNGNQYKYPVVFLGIISSKFEEANKTIESFFVKQYKNNLESLTENSAETCQINDENNFSKKCNSNLEQSKTERSDKINSINDVNNSTINNKIQNKSQPNAFFELNKNIDAANSKTFLEKQKNLFELKKIENKNSFFTKYRFQNLLTVEENSTVNSSSSLNVQHSENLIECDNTMENFETITSNDNEIALYSHAHQDPEKISIIENNSSKLCYECNTMISLIEFDSHSDYHLALKIASENQDILSINTSNKIISDSKEISIDRQPSDISILSKIILENKEHTEDTPSSSTSYVESKENSNENVEICATCNEKVLLIDFLEHLDYHTAKNLQKELNDIPITNNTTNSLQVKSTNVRKTKSKRNISKTETTNKKFKPISNYFKPVT